MLVHLPEDITPEAVRDGLVATIATLPAHLRGSLTWDQGCEMARHQQFAMATDMPVYRATRPAPGSGHQREHQRPAAPIPQRHRPERLQPPADLEHVAQQLNGRPRKTLDWDTPAERLRDLLLPH